LADIVPAGAGLEQGELATGQDVFNIFFIHEKVKFLKPDLERALRVDLRH
jgi:hypothetical protein